MKRMIALYRKEAEKLNRAQIGQHQLVLVEGVSNLIAHKLQKKYLYFSSLNILILFFIETYMF